MGSARTKKENNPRRDNRPPAQASQFIRFMGLAAAVLAVVIAPQWAAAGGRKLNLPYATIVHPQFVSGSDATFLSPPDLLIGVTDGKTAKAYPAAILAQHGVVQDRMGDGPIAVTW